MRARKVTVLVLAICAMALVPTPSLGMEDCEGGGDAGNSSTAASPVSSPLICAGELADGTDEDWYRFDTEDAPEVQASLKPLPGSVFELRLIAPDGTDVSDSCAELALGASCLHINPVDGSWKLGVRRVAGSAGPYVLEILSQSVPPIPPIGPVPNPTSCPESAWHTPATVTPPLACTRTASSAGYQFDVPERGSVLAKVSLRVSQDDVPLFQSMSITGPLNAPVAGGSCITDPPPGLSGTPGPGVCSLLLVPAGTYKLTFILRDRVPFVVTLAVVPPASTVDCEPFGDVDDSIPTAIQPPTTCVGSLWGNDEDRYSFDVVSQVGVVEVAAEPLAGPGLAAPLSELCLTVTDPEANVYSDCVGRTVIIATAPGQPLPRGTWRVAIDQTGNPGGYALSVNAAQL